MSSPPSFTELLSAVKREVDDELVALWDAALHEHAARGPAVLGPLDAARALCARGGKRLRAALVAVGHQLGGGDGRALAACCAVELLQAYFLIHDDWMDGDRLRRGGPAVHAALETQFASAHLAAAGAVLAGDYTLALATRQLARVQAPEGRWPQLVARFAQMQLDAVIGQKLDVLGDGSNLEEVYRLKTGSYTVLGPLLLGLELCPPRSDDASVRAALEAFALPLGIAFQLRDDLIGAYADPSVTGKPLGGDLRAGKRTLLVNLVLARRGSEAERLLTGVLGNAEASNAEVERALAALEACGARAEVEQRIAGLARQASQALDAGAWSRDARAVLDGLSRAMLERTA
ncbi:MAG TPA: polyprenyl synthetase family protein [Polyangiaceae bacterium]|nr:polyprenyl synthetase family protein [Polyangiaceae bacterium]